ncbi:RNA polymerase factor sigma-54 [Beijerinckia indica]|uniref:RNA polymerase sigma-54 factor n=1 Tax=Beijerinckia indica subsp. indica (strain ATCC 9039 / DSM 1715 / NCIMB 8712) TaxID=395963 RepID=B2IFK8_BEII9|nr:RNA polymerase factor sigma-54 [Beijerinckia indica]ACB94219.1 RNA polymerase, sigma 54 subunit, RpoN [Beijerinckia indica subsp. indica ATCC 9039]
MALSTKLVMRQGQSLVMTPQLLQAIKLLQFSNLELAAFVEDELERNPLLERAEEAHEPYEPMLSTAYEAKDGHDFGDPEGHAFNESSEADWNSESFATDRGSMEASLGTELSNTFDDDRAPTPGDHHDAGLDGYGLEGAGLSATSWSGTSGLNGDGEATNLEAYVAAEATLKDHLAGQLAIATSDPVDRLIGNALIDSLDEVGYLTDPVEDIAQRLGTSVQRVERMLGVVQTFDPSGVGARNLSECLAIQLRERDRLDPAMQALLNHLGLLAKRDFAALRKICQVDEEDILDMLNEIRRLDPKPGRAFGSSSIQPVVPDVIVRPLPDGSWHVELNADVLPRILVNHTYAARVSKVKAKEADKAFMSNCLQTANWLTKSLEQRARTILKVSSEIVRQQDAFFAKGVEHLRPLNLKTIADAIGMHESTVSRVTSNKYMTTPRGLFELKYFFTASINAHNGGEAHSAESVRFRIKQMIDQESAKDILSDDAIVARLKEANIDIARRTVAKYRDSLKIPSSVERRREKAL